MEATFCVEVLQRALKGYPAPFILNSDQGTQYTSQAWIEALNEAGIKISMDGKGRWADNVYVERLWRTIKYEHMVHYARRAAMNLRIIDDRYPKRRL